MNQQTVAKMSVVLICFASAVLAGLNARQAAGQTPAAPAVGSGDLAGKPGSQPASTLAPVSLFTDKDIPEAEPGKPAWLPGKAWCYGIVYYDKWVYAVSKAEYILQFERDPATAKLTYKGATAFARFHSDAQAPNVACGIRRLDNGNAILAILAGNDNPGWWYATDKGGFMWYAIDKDTGKPSAAGKQVPAQFDKHNAQQLWTPDQQRFCVGGYVWTKIYSYRFGEDGAPVEDGSFALKNWPNGNYGSVRFSPDWRHMYYLVVQRSEDPLCDKTPQIDTYEIDPKTHAGTYRSSLELPIAGTPKEHVSGAIEPLSPDGKHLYVFFDDGPSAYYYVLARDPDSGKLTIMHQKTEPTLRGVGGAPWSCLDRFAFAGDGKSGYYIFGSDRVKGGPLGSFTRDPGTGALTFLPPVEDMGAQKLVVDPVAGNLFTVGEKIASFKIPASGKAMSSK